MEFHPTLPFRVPSLRIIQSLLFMALFTPPAPCGARPHQCGGVSPLQDFNPRAPCGARRLPATHGHGADGISIHAPLAGRDIFWASATAAGSRFQSTRPLRGATEYNAAKAAGDRFQSTRPLRGAT